MKSDSNTSRASFLGFNLCNVLFMRSTYCVNFVSHTEPRRHGERQKLKDFTPASNYGLSTRIDSPTQMTPGFPP